MSNKVFIARPTGADHLRTSAVGVVVACGTDEADAKANVLAAIAASPRHGLLGDLITKLSGWTFVEVPDDDDAAFYLGGNLPPDLRL